jgi:hypothetical protein
MAAEVLSQRRQGSVDAIRVGLRHLFRECSLVRLTFATLSTTLRSEGRNIATNSGIPPLAPELMLNSSFESNRREPMSEISKRP